MMPGHTSEGAYTTSVAAIDAENDARNIAQSKSSDSDAASTGQEVPSKTPTGKFSEHGHSLAKIRPMTKHSGQSVATFFNGLFQTIIAIGTLGTSVTFSFMLSNNADLATPEAYYSPKEVQTLLAVSWLLFLLSLAFASLGSTLLTFFKAHWMRDWDGEHGKRSQVEVQLYAVFASALIGGLVIGAFLILCLVVVAYTPAVGWIAIGFTGFFGLIMLVAITYQVPWPWRDNVPDQRRMTP